jgi:hypothetical protein
MSANAAQQLPLWAAWLSALAPAFAVAASAGAVFVSVLTFRLSRQIAQRQAFDAKEKFTKH